MSVMRNFLLIGVLSMCCMNMQCDDNDDVIIIEEQTISSCNEEAVLVDEVIFNNTTNDSYTIESADILNDCLNLTIGASGCSPDNWEFDLIDSSLIAESSPVQRYIKLKFVNPEACLAVFTHSLSFDLFDIRVPNESQIRIHIEGYEDDLVYTY